MIKKSLIAILLICAVLAAKGVEVSCRYPGSCDVDSCGAAPSGGSVWEKSKGDTNKCVIDDCDKIQQASTGKTDYSCMSCIDGNKSYANIKGDTCVTTYCMALTGWNNDKCTECDPTRPYASEDLYSCLKYDCQNIKSEWTNESCVSCKPNKTKALPDKTGCTDCKLTQGWTDDLCNICDSSKPKANKEGTACHVDCAKVTKWTNDFCQTCDSAKPYAKGDASSCDVSPPNGENGDEDSFSTLVSFVVSSLAFVFLL